MKKKHIEEVLASSNIPLADLKRMLDKSTQFPVFKTKEHTETDASTGDSTRYTTYLCGSCNCRFEVVDGTNYNAQCPECGNLYHGYQRDTLKDTPQDFAFQEDDELVLRTFSEYLHDDELCSRMHLIAFDCTLNGSFTADTFNNLFVLEKHSIDGNHYFALRQLEYFCEFDILNAKKRLTLIDLNNVMIFSDSEFVCVKNGKVSTGRASSCIRQGSWRNSSWRTVGHKQIIFGDVAVYDELYKVVDGYGSKITAGMLFQNTNTRSCFAVSLKMLDSLQEFLEKQQVHKKTPNKRTAMVDYIVNNIPKTKPFTINDGRICLTEVARDTLNRITTYSFLCPNCHSVEKIAVKDGIYSYRIYNDAGRVFSCPDCGTVYDFCNAVNFFHNHDCQVNVTVVDNFDDGIIIFDTTYTQTINGNTFMFEPLPNAQSFKIAVILPRGEEFETFNLRYDVNKRRYILARNYTFEATPPCIIYNAATNMDMQASHIDTLNRHGALPSVDEISAYALLWQKYPILGEILKGEYYKIVHDIVCSFDYTEMKARGNYNLEANTIANALCIPAECLDILCETPRHSLLDALREMQTICRCDSTFSRQHFEYIRKHCLCISDMGNLCMQYGFTIADICAYLEKVRLRQYMGASTALTYWNEYLSFLLQNGCFSHIESVCFPENLRVEYDRMQYEWRFARGGEHVKAYAKLVEQRAGVVTFDYGEFKVSFPQDIRELFAACYKLGCSSVACGDRITNGKSFFAVIERECDAPVALAEVVIDEDCVAEVCVFGNCSLNENDMAKLFDFIMTSLQS